MSSDLRWRRWLLAVLVGAFVVPAGLASVNEPVFVDDDEATRKTMADAMDGQAPERMPQCADPAHGPGHVQVVHARAFDDLDAPGSGTWDGDEWQYSTSQVEDLVLQADAAVDESALRDAVHGDLVVRCDQGEVHVQRVVLWTPAALADFNTIKTELANHHGLRDPRVKYWVFYDDPGPAATCMGCGGRWDFFPDNRTAAAGNVNNGVNLAYAVTWFYDWTLFLRHGGHSLGAVPPGSPNNSTFAGQTCRDGNDFLCYGAGTNNNVCPNASPPPPSGGALNPDYWLWYTGPYLAWYWTNTWVPLTGVGDRFWPRWDCNHNDYFDPAPPAASWLATHWNLADPAVLYTELGRSTMDGLQCPETAFEDRPVACTFLGGNPEATGVRYRVDWGDGTTQSIPSAATWARTKEPTTGTHVYAAPGDYVVRVHARDNGGAAQESLGMPFRIHVLPDPLADVQACVAGTDDCPVDLDVW